MDLEKILSNLNFSTPPAWKALGIEDYYITRHSWQIIISAHLHHILDVLHCLHKRLSNQFGFTPI